MVPLIIYLTLSGFSVLSLMLQKRSKEKKKVQVFNEFKARGIEPLDENGQFADKEFERICHEIDGTKLYFATMALFLILHLPSIVFIRFTMDKKLTIPRMFLPSYIVILPTLYFIF